MIFVNTRPISRAKPLSEALQDKGMTVLQMPLLELASVDISERERQYQQNFYQQPTSYQALVVVSPTAARIGLSTCPKGFIPQCAVIAVGHATAEVLRAEGWPVQCPDEYSNEGMIKMASLNKLGAGDQVLVWRGRGGRRVLVNFLQDNGVRVDAIAWYQRRRPIEAINRFHQLQQQLTMLASNPAQLPQLAKQTSAESNTKPVVLISSGEAFTHWRFMFSEVEPESVPFQLNDFNYLTFGKRLTETLRALDLTCARVEHLDTEEVCRGIENLQSNIK